MVSMTFLFAAVNSGHAHYLSTMSALTCTVVHSRRVLSQTNSKMFFFLFILFLAKMTTHATLTLTQAGGAVAESQQTRNHAPTVQRALRPELELPLSRTICYFPSAHYWKHTAHTHISISLYLFIYYYFFRATLPEARQPPHRSYFPTELEFMSPSSDRHADSDPLQPQKSSCSD